MPRTRRRRGKTHIVDYNRPCPSNLVVSARQTAAGFTVKQSAFVDIEALLTAMSTREDLLRQFQEGEAREHQRELQRQEEDQERERLLLQQQESEDSEPAPADAVE